MDRERSRSTSSYTPHLNQLTSLSHTYTWTGSGLDLDLIPASEWGETEGTTTATGTGTGTETGVIGTEIGIGIGIGGIGGPEIGIVIEIEKGAIGGTGRGVTMVARVTGTNLDARVSG